jgi:formylglycine-generating enzyme required for sulfatase activity
MRTTFAAIVLACLAGCKYPGPPVMERDRPPIRFDEGISQVEAVAQLRDGETLHGRVLRETVTLAAPYGAVEIPLDQCSTLTFGESVCDPATALTVNANRITGVVLDKSFCLRVRPSGLRADIPREMLLSLSLSVRGAQPPEAQKTSNADVFVMANGDVLTGKAAEDAVAIRTKAEVVPVTFDRMRELKCQYSDGVVSARLATVHDEIRYGQLATGTLTVELAFGARLADLHLAHLAGIYPGQAGELAPMLCVREGPTAETAGDATTAAPVTGLTNSVGMQFAPIPRGWFWMGSPQTEVGRDEDESPQHVARLSRGFLMAKTEVTQAQWFAVMGTRPWAGNKKILEGEEYPATYVTFQEALEFCRKLTEAEGRPYRLPTEAEWEYACRAGSLTRFTFGDDERDLRHWAWFSRGTETDGVAQAHPVGRKQPNAWGLFDMHGNVAEWTADWYGEYPAHPVTEPRGPETGLGKVVRGGSADSHAAGCRSAARSRGYDAPFGRHYLDGFRVVLDEPPSRHAE